MGTPEFACPTLKKLLIDPKFEIVAVYSREPQIAGRDINYKIRQFTIWRCSTV